MNVSYRVNFILRWGFPLLLFFIFFTSPSKIALVLAILSTIQVIAFGADIHKKGHWNKINIQHDQRTKKNALLSGYIIYWATIVCLLVGAVLIQKAIISLTYPKLIGYIIFIGLIMRMIIRDYLNTREAAED